MITYHLGTHCVQVKQSGGEEANVGNCTNMYGNHVQLKKQALQFVRWVSVT